MYEQKLRTVFSYDTHPPKMRFSQKLWVRIFVLDFFWAHDTSISHPWETHRGSISKMLRRTAKSRMSNTAKIK